MQFLYYEETTPHITLSGEEHKYLFKVRRLKKEDEINIRNLKDDYLYIYQITHIDKKSALLSLKEKRYTPKKANFFHLAWCVIEPKNIEKALPSLNEIGVSKITFVYCDYSQKNFKLNLNRMRKILINSSQQCGRSTLMEIEILNSSKEFFQKYDTFYALHFNGKEIECDFYDDKPFLIGPEGGFSQKEIENFQKTFKFKTHILRSETAALGVCAKILL